MPYTSVCPCRLNPSVTFGICAVAGRIAIGTISKAANLTFALLPFGSRSVILLSLSVVCSRFSLGNFSRLELSRDCFLHLRECRLQPMLLPDQFSQCLTRPVFSMREHDA